MNEIANWSLVRKTLHGPRPKPHLQLACKLPIYTAVQGVNQLEIYSDLHPVNWQFTGTIYKCKSAICTSVNQQLKAV